MSRVTLAMLARHFMAAPAKLEAAVRRELRRVGSKVRDDATLKFGHYQPAIGPYPGWVKLHPVTIAQKAKAGGGEDPLIGHYPKGQKNTVWPMPLRTTIQSHVDERPGAAGLQVHIGTRDPLGRWHEYGTPRVPPRPFLRPAAFQNERYFIERMQAAWEEAIRSL